MLERVSTRVTNGLTAGFNGKAIATLRTNRRRIVALAKVVDTLKKLAAGAGVSPVWFVNGVSDPDDRAREGDVYPNRAAAIEMSRRLGGVRK